MLNSRSIQGAVIFILGMFVAIWLGLSLVTEQFETLLKVSVASILIVAILLGRRVWLLLILFSSMNVVLMRGFGTLEIGQAVFITFSLILFMMRKLRLNFQFRELEVWALLIIICILQTYLRNPVGLNLFGSGNVGGKPYVILGLTITTAAILSRMVVEEKEIRWAMWTTIIGSLIGIPGTILRYGGLGNNPMDQGEPDSLARVPVMGVFSALLARILVSWTSPLRAFFHPGWGFVLLVSVAAAGASGYRNSIAMVGLIYLVGICYRSGGFGLFGSLLAGSFSLLLLALINLNFPLPGNIQRALSPLPGTWEAKYKNQAALSTEWRIEMWKEALTSDRWIHDKILGDGVGMTAEQLAQNQRLDATTVGKSASGSGLLVQQENMLVNGSYHSGPVHTIRAVGYVGLIILLLAMIRVAVHAHRQIQRCKGTEWFTVSLFFCVPLIVQPFFFVFIFGEFHTGVAFTVTGIAMVRILENGLTLPKWAPRRRQPYVLKNHRHAESRTLRA